MAHFLILYKAGPDPTDLVPCGVVEKTLDEVDEAILEGATRGQGEYVAVRFDESKITRKQVVSELAVTDLPEEPEAPPSEPEDPPGEEEPEAEPPAEEEG